MSQSAATLALDCCSTPCSKFEPRFPAPISAVGIGSEDWANPPRAAAAALTRKVLRATFMLLSHHNWMKGQSGHEQHRSVNLFQTAVFLASGGENGISSHSSRLAGQRARRDGGSPGTGAEYYADTVAKPGGPP